jgi:hypothetical protein
MATAIIQVAALRVKVKSLAAEAQMIRREERRALRSGDMDLYVSLRSHRVREWRDGVRSDVRREQRAALLAYAFIRGMAYARVEQPAPDNPPDLKRVGQLVEKYGCPVGGYPKYKLPDGLLAQWVSGALSSTAHPFAREAKVATAA